MKLLLTVKKITDNSFIQELKFSDFPVKLGRESDNEVILEDPRKIVSRSHARIVNESGQIQIIDLGSANFTYLNNERIFPNDAVQLKTGDFVKIGDYEIEIVIEQEAKIPSFDGEKTMVFSSPFESEVANLTDSIMKLSGKYLFDDSPLKSEMLRFSIVQSFERIGADDVSRILSEYFATKFLDQDISLKKEVLSTPKPVEKSEIRNVPPSPPAKPVSDYSFSIHFTESVDVLLETMIKLIQGFLQFRQEFFGVTIYQTIPTGSLQDIKDYLFNQEISSDEQKKRISMFKEEMQKLLTHQIGLLEGYRISITEGSQSLLQSLDPEIIEKEVSVKQSSMLENLIPNSKKVKTLDAIKLNYKKYMSDPYHIEKKFFRPAFIKGYQMRKAVKNEFNEY